MPANSNISDLSTNCSEDCGELHEIEEEVESYFFGDLLIPKYSYLGDITIKVYKNIPQVYYASYFWLCTDNQDNAYFAKKEKRLPVVYTFTGIFRKAYDIQM